MIMKIKLTGSLFLLMLCFNSFSQKTGIERKDSLLRDMLLNQCYCDSPGKCKGDDKTKYFYTGRQYITNYSMNRLIRKDITKITSDEEGLPVVGNYATVKVSDDKSNVTFNASIYNPFIKPDTLDNKPMRSILSFNIRAGISEGVTTLFSNQNINNEAGVKIKLSLLSKKTLYENDSSVDCNKLKLYRERLSYEYEDIRARYLIDSSVYVRKRNEYWETVPKMESVATNFKRQLDSLRGLPELVDVHAKAVRDSLIKRTSFLADSAGLKHLDTKREYDEFQSKKPRYVRKDVVDSIYRKLLEIETKNVKWHRFRIQWWDIDAEMNGHKYNLYNEKMPLDSQLSKKNFTQWGLGISFNHFSSKPNIPFLKHGVFIKLSYLLANDNTLSGAETKEIRTTVFSDTPNFRREVISKVNAYDIPFAGLYSHTFKSQFSKYLNEKKTSALSLYSTWVLAFKKFKNPLSIDGKPDISFGTGYLIVFLDKEKEKNIINLELFFNFNDLLNSGDAETKFFQRHQLGMKFGVPFNSIFLNSK